MARAFFLPSRGIQRLGMPLDVVYALDHLTLSLCLSALRTSTTRCEHLESTSTVASAAHAAAEEADAAVGPRRSLQSDGKKKTAGDAKKPMGQNKGAKGATSGSAKASVEETTSYVRNLKLKFTIFQVRPLAQSNERPRHVRMLPRSWPHWL